MILHAGFSSSNPDDSQTKIFNLFQIFTKRVRLWVLFISSGIWLKCYIMKGILPHLIIIQHSALLFFSNRMFCSPLFKTFYSFLTNSSFTIIGHALKMYEWNDDQMYLRTMALKQKNSNLKVLLAVGGWNHENCDTSEKTEAFIYA